MSALICCVLVAQASTKVHADEGDLYVSLDYQAAASTRDCWDEARFRRGVAHRVGYDPFRENAPLSVQVRVGGSSVAVDGQVEWRDVRGASIGERRFVAKDGNCGKLMTEMSFAVGLQIEFLRLKPVAPTPTENSAPKPARDPNSAAADQALPPALPVVVLPPSDESEKRPAPEAPAEVAESPTAASRRWTMWVGGGPTLAWRLSPQATIGGRIFLGLGRRHFSFELGIDALYPTTVHRWDGSGFRHSLFGTSVAICGNATRFSACALGRADQVRVTGLGVDQPRSPSGFLVQAGARLAGKLYTSDTWAIATHVDGLALLTSSTVHLNQAPVWEMPRLGAMAGFDVTWRFR